MFHFEVADYLQEQGFTKSSTAGPGFGTGAAADGNGALVYYFAGFTDEQDTDNQQLRQWETALRQRYEVAPATVPAGWPALRVTPKGDQS